MGASGRIAQAFLRSKLTPLIVITSLAMGALALIATPPFEHHAAPREAMIGSLGLPP